MAAEPEHSRIIAVAAKQTLAPIGMRRQGRSRLWFSDEGLWAAIVEFQPFSFSKGSYLNVAAHWLWTTNDYIPFDYSTQPRPSIDYYSPEQFRPLAEEFAIQAARRVLDLRQQLYGLQAIIDIQMEKIRTKRRSRPD